MTPDPILQAASEAVLSNARLALARVREAMGTSEPVPDSGPHCRVCHTDYHSRTPDGRCGLCKARRRYWRPEQLGSRAQVWITSRAKPELYGCTGVGTRTDKPEDGWKVRLLESPERSLYFGAASVEVDWEIRATQAPERSVWQVAGRVNGHSSQESPVLAPGGGPAVVCDVPGRQASQRSRNANEP